MRMAVPRMVVSGGYLHAQYDDREIMQQQNLYQRKLSGHANMLRDP
jgi:hypothetical protein